MTAQTTFSLEAIDAALAAAGPSLGPDEQRLAAAVLRLLSAGEPVSITAAAAAALIPGPQAITYRIGADGVVTVPRTRTRCCRFCVRASRGTAP